MNIKMVHSNDIVSNSNAKVVYSGNILCVLFTAWEVCIEKNFAQGLECKERGTGRRLWIQDQVQIFSLYGRPRPVNDYCSSPEICLK